MFIVLLVGSLCLSLVVSFFLARVFRQPVSAVIGRIVPEEIGSAWVKYILFAMHVAGISSGVRVWDIERYITPAAPGREGIAMELNSDRIVFECYRTLIGTLQGISGVLLIFFVIAIIAYVVVRLVESRREKST